MAGRRRRAALAHQWSIPPLPRAGARASHAIVSFSEGVRLWVARGAINTSRAGSWRKGDLMPTSSPAKSEARWGVARTQIGLTLGGGHTNRLRRLARLARPARSQRRRRRAHQYLSFDAFRTAARRASSGAEPPDRQTLPGRRPVGSAACCRLKAYCLGRHCGANQG